MNGIKIELLEEVARASRMLYEQGLSPTADSGDVSLRDPETGYIYITGGPIGKDEEIFNLSDCIAKDMCVLDINGKRILENENYPTMEHPMHLAVYRARPEVNAVFHSHAQWSGVFAITGKTIPNVLVEQFVRLGGDIRCTGPIAAGSESLGDEVVRTLGSRNAAIMRHHGAIAVGTTVQKAIQNAIYLENAAKKCIFAMLMGGVETIDRLEDVVDEKFIASGKGV